MCEYNFLYTDGSMVDNVVSFSVTTESNIIMVFTLPSYSSILSAELIATHRAVKHLGKRKRKYVICSKYLVALKKFMEIAVEKKNFFFIDSIISRIFKATGLR